MARPVGGWLAALILTGCTVVNPPTPTQAPASTEPPAATATTEPAPATSPPPTGGPTATPAPSTATVPAHRIAVRDAGDRRELFDAATGEPFIARGVNLLRLERFGDRLYDTLFGTDYDPAWVDDTLGRLAGLGYNTVRVFLDLCTDDCIALASGGLSPGYMDHVADFLDRAKRHGIFVMPASNDLPDTADFGNSMPCCSPFGGYRNSVYLSALGHAAAASYWQQIVGGLIERGAATDAVLAWQLVNEQFVLLDVPPLSLRSGSVATADGRTWDMASDEQRRQMVESNVVAFADSLRTAIRELDPTALVTMGWFAPNEPVEWRPNDTRLVLTRTILEQSALDFADLHAYPGGSFDVADHLLQYGVTQAVRMPLLMGEMGAFKFSYSTPAEGAGALVAWQLESCQSFQGWLLWLEADSNDEVWGGSEDGGVIDEALAPATRPDPCDGGGFVRHNLAVGAAVRASNAVTDNPPRLAIDDAPGTTWIAGGGPPQWIEIDLGGTFDLASIELIVAQTPSGFTRHRVLVGSARGDLRQVAALRGDTSDGALLTVELDQSDGQSVRYVRVETMESPSWVAWREIRVFGR